ncbi:hypothetical protein [Cohnella sp.]|uniref:hypothetical protein n=1 Tax=Cohnella sp. TaxID=1883426 RepID=UPI00356364F5
MSEYNQTEDAQENQNIIEKIAAFAGEMSGDHDTSDEIEEIKQNQGYTSSTE